MVCMSGKFILLVLCLMDQQSSTEKRNMGALPQHSSAAGGFKQAEMWLIIRKIVQREELAKNWR